MDKFFGILLLSSSFTALLMVPFINLLYFLKFRTPQVESVDSLGRKTPFNKLMGNKVGTPTGGGVLLITSTFLFTLIFYGLTQFSLNWTAWILFATLFLFGMLGLYDDWLKFFGVKEKKAWLFDFKYKLFVQILFGIIVSSLLYYKMGLHLISIPVITALTSFRLELGWWFIPIAAFIIISTSNAFNIADGLDGLSAGLLVIALSAFWALTGYSSYGGDVSLFIATIIGALLVYLYFNIFPARIFYGDTAALAFGAVLAVIALILDQALVLPIIGGMFVVEGASSLIQMLSFKFRNGKRVFKIAPLHHHFQVIGWEETKVTMRFWLFGIVLAFAGLFLATFGLG
ncbi:phospho-N-acetylmuramoyl-pentapeptide-transferase [candidate division WWE3 bacterium]|nr:phospho-N-acetylmuramoyl-pentapeptide-transferase [candidate division WWE3 bacterium]